MSAWRKAIWALSMAHAGVRRRRRRRPRIRWTRCSARPCSSGCGSPRRPPPRRRTASAPCSTPGPAAPATRAAAAPRFRCRRATCRRPPALALRVGAALDGKLAPHPLLGSQVQTMAVPGLSPEGRLRVTFETHSERLADGTELELRRPRFVITGDGQAGRPRLAVAAPGARPARRRPAGACSAGAAGGTGRSRRSRRRRHLRLGRDGPVWRRGHRARPLRLEGRRAGPDAPGLRRLPFRSRPRRRRCGASCGAIARRRKPICRAAPQGAAPGNVEVESSRGVAGRDLSARRCRRRPGRPPPIPRTAARSSPTIGCGGCHTAQQPAELAGSKTIWFAPYSDLLVHDMGDGLADRAADDSVSTVAGARDWRTAPLWGLGARVARQGRRQPAA